MKRGFMCTLEGFRAMKCVLECTGAGVRAMKCGFMCSTERTSCNEMRVYVHARRVSRRELQLTARSAAVYGAVKSEDGSEKICLLSNRKIRSDGIM